MLSGRGAGRIIVHGLYVRICGDVLLEIGGGEGREVLEKLWRCFLLWHGRAVACNGRGSGARALISGIL